MDVALALKIDFKTLDRLPAIIYFKSLEGVYLQINAAFLTFLGKDRSEVVGKNSVQLFGEKVASQFRKNDLEIARSQKPLSVIEYAVGHDRVERYFRSHKFPVFDDNREIIGTGGMSLDITDEYKLRSELFFREGAMLTNFKISNLGKLASAMSHEIKTPLSVILGNAEIIKEQIEDPDMDKVSLRNHVAAIVDTVDRMKGILDGLKGLTSSNIKMSSGRLHLNEIIKEVLSFYANNELVNGVEFDLSRLEDGIEVNGVKSQIFECFSNVILNALEAIQPMPKRRIEIESELDNDKAQVHILDSGPGIPVEEYDRVTEFFYTRGKSTGTGIGLALTKHILVEHGGELSFSRRNGMNTVTIALPLQPPRFI